MNPSVLSSGWDTFLFGILFIGLLLIAFFRVDEIFAAPAPPSTRRRKSTVTGIDEEGEPILCDPDGRQWLEPPSGK